MQSKQQFFEMLRDRDIDLPSAGLIDDAYTEYDLDFKSAGVVKRFLDSFDIDTRYESAIALTQANQIDGLEIDALLLFIEGKRADHPCQYHGVEMLQILARRNSEVAIRILSILACDHAFVAENLPSFLELATQEGVKLER